jgi:hypothetical protein
MALVSRAELRCPKESNSTLGGIGASGDVGVSAAAGPPPPPEQPASARAMKSVEARTVEEQADDRK